MIKAVTNFTAFEKLKLLDGMACMKKRLGLIRRTITTMLIATAGIAGSAQASIVNLEGVTSCYDLDCNNVQGFDFSFFAAGWGVSDDGNNYFNRNGRSASEGLVGARGARDATSTLYVSMTQSGGGAFDLGQLDMATGYSGFAGNAMIEVIGSLSGGGQISELIEVSSAWNTFFLTGFTGVTEVTFLTRNAVAGVSIDNLNSEGRGTVPEPGSLALIGLGLAGLIERRRRKSA